MLDACSAYFHDAGRCAHLLEGELDVGRGDVEAVLRRQLVAVAPEVLVPHAPPLSRVGCRVAVHGQAAQVCTLLTISNDITYTMSNTIQVYKFTSIHDDIYLPLQDLV